MDAINEKKKRNLPKPIDLSHINLPDALKGLVEDLSENTHNVWMQKRISEGWTWGAERNDKLKETPCLVPYSELSESEKEYDRCSSVETIKMLLALGYSISKPD